MRTGNKFVLTRQNQKGQMAIFIALIFQIIFVFFALLINVGLLVHHKINLQQSADLAAYYGAMKQAEVMNAMAHINFQIRQNWKLLTWRYRILGTFGFMAANEGGGSQRFPFELTPGGFAFNAVSDDTSALRCPVGSPVAGYGIQDIPFFCIGHPGFGGWPEGESACRVNCQTFNEARAIAAIPSAGTAVTPSGGNAQASVNRIISTVNTTNTLNCQNLGLYGAAILARFMASYIYESRYRTQTFDMLAKNLSLPSDEILDLEGELIKKGAQLTFLNNLTDANQIYHQNNTDAFSVISGLSQDNCRFQDGVSNNTEFVKRIEFDFINYFIHNCRLASEVSGPGSWSYKPEPVYGNSGDGLGSAFQTLDQPIKDIAVTLLGVGAGSLRKKDLHTVGYEKNPYCVEYYAVKATSEPTIPFLPLKKIKLHATAVAKPFGGSMGPWYGKNWSVGSARSDIIENNADSASTRVDQALPFRRFNGNEGVSNIAQSVYYQPNFSLFVGDTLGLRRNSYIAAYHQALALRNIGPLPINNYDSNPNTLPKYTNPNDNAWPSFKTDWADIDKGQINDVRQYDSLARVQSGVRALEVSAIAPNQFDITHFSIEPDFYNNYYKKLYKGFDNIKQATGEGPENKNQLRPDFGTRDVEASFSDPTEPGDLRTFSVKDQIYIKNHVFEGVNLNPAGGSYSTYSDVFKFLVSLQSSLLTSWTFLNFTQYEKFPEEPLNVAAGVEMSFGQCENAWNNTQNAQFDKKSSDNFKTPLNERGPVVAGNCVTGGRTGYSVKIASPHVLKDGNEVLNPLPQDLFNF